MDKTGKPIGFAISLPDVNVLLKGLNGKLGLRGLWRMLFRLPKLTQYRMWALGVVPEYQSCALIPCFTRPPTRRFGRLTHAWRSITYWKTMTE